MLGRHRGILHCNIPDVQRLNEFLILFGWPAQWFRAFPEIRIDVPGLQCVLLCVVCAWEGTYWPLRWGNMWSFPGFVIIMTIFLESNHVLKFPLKSLHIKSTHSLEVQLSFLGLLSPVLEPFWFQLLPDDIYDFTCYFSAKRQQIKIVSGGVWLKYIS